MEVSVIVPVYNAESTLSRCVDSIREQTKKDIEIVLVDDGSNDKSCSICKKMQNEDDRIIIVQKKNGGPHSARKTGLLHAKADLVCFVDADDWIEADLIERLTETQYKTEADMVVFGYTVEKFNTIENVSNGIDSNTYNKEMLQKEVYSTMLCPNGSFCQNIVPALHAKLFKKTILTDIMNSIDESICIGEDLACTLAYLLHSNIVTICNENVQYHYCIQANTISFRYDKDYFIKSLKLASYLEDLIKECDVESILSNIECYEAFLVYRYISTMIWANNIREYYRFLNSICIEDNLKIITSLLNKMDITYLSLNQNDKALLVFLQENQLNKFKMICLLRFIWNRFRKV